MGPRRRAGGGGGGRVKRGESLCVRVDIVVDVFAAFRVRSPSLDWSLGWVSRYLTGEVMRRMVHLRGPPLPGAATKR